MTHHATHYSQPHPAVEVLLEHGFEGLSEALKLLFNEVMKIERSNALQATPFERTEARQGYANGFKPKTVSTRVGDIEFSIPQVRGDVEFYPSCLEKGLKSERALNMAIAEMYIQGVSTRKVDQIIQKLSGAHVSREKVSQLTKELDAELEKWRNRPLGQVEYLVLDARYENVRVDSLVHDCAVLVAYGVLPDGRRSILGVHVSLGEAEIHWRTFLRKLKHRGLYGVKMITSDDHAGLKAALKTEFGGIPWQRCQFHLQQNASGYVPRKEMRKEVASDIRSIFNAPNLEEAERLLGIYTEKYSKRASDLSIWMRKNLPEGFTVFTLPEGHRKKLRTSNMAERQNQELKRRTRVIEIFPNKESLLRITSAILKEQSEAWGAGKVYLTMEENS